MDMMKMTFTDATFTCVLDKATMDVVLTDLKDPWNPSDEIKDRAHKTLSECSRVLINNGVFVQISFDQPHFRKKYLLREEYKWADFNQKNIDKGLGYFMYIMNK